MGGSGPLGPLILWRSVSGPPGIFDPPGISASLGIPDLLRSLVTCGLWSIWGLWFPWVSDPLGYLVHMGSLTHLGVFHPHNHDPLYSSCGDHLGRVWSRYNRGLFPLFSPHSSSRPRPEVREFSSPRGGQKPTVLPGGSPEQLPFGGTPGPASRVWVTLGLRGTVRGETLSPELRGRGRG